MGSAICHCAALQHYERRRATGLGGGFTTVSSHLPTAEAPVGLVAVTVRRTLPVPAVPTEKVAVTIFEPPAVIKPTSCTLRT